MIRYLLFARILGIVVLSFTASFLMLKEMLPGVTINSRLRADDKGKRHFDSNGRLMGDYESGYERRLPEIGRASCRERV